ncbi:MAG: hypothetical protein NW201_10865 [Gemmatimonadales bacterium]|nr:hypothetical protein [Gemmatimonadales bacterium]
MTVHALSVTWAGHPTAFDRMLGLLRRRRIGVRSLAARPLRDGVGRLLAVLDIDAPAAERLVLVLAKVPGVSEVRAHPVTLEGTREVALVALRPGAAERAELFDVVQLYHAAVMEETREQVTLELVGSEPFVQSALRALERFGITDVVRSGTISLGPGAAPEGAAA